MEGEEEEEEECRKRRESKDFGDGWMGWSDLDGFRWRGGGWMCVRCVGQARNVGKSEFFSILTANSCLYPLIHPPLLPLIHVLNVMY